jgi:hypothetical protein
MAKDLASLKAKNKSAEDKIQSGERANERAGMVTATHIH